MTIENESFNANLRKKLSSLIEKTSEYILKHLNDHVKNIVRGVCAYLLRKGARYLRQDSIQVIRMFLYSKSGDGIDLEDYKGKIY